MPARSKSQQRLFGMLHAYNKGELNGSKSLMRKMKEMSRHISDEDAQHFAKTPHDGLPEKKAFSLNPLNQLSNFSPSRIMNWLKGEPLPSSGLTIRPEAAGNSTKNYISPSSGAQNLSINTGNNQWQIQNARPSEHAPSYREQQFAPIYENQSTRLFKYTPQEFYRDIYPGIANAESMRDKGMPADPSHISRIQSLERIPVSYADNDPNLSIGGAYYPETDSIWINPRLGGDRDSSLVHEYRHKLLGSPGYGNYHRANPQSSQDLADEYGFSETNAAADYYAGGTELHNESEARATNAQFQYSIASWLAKKLGRSPTYDEYKDFVNKLSDRGLLNEREVMINGYDLAARWRRWDQNIGPKKKWYERLWDNIKGSPTLPSNRELNPDPENKQPARIRRLLLETTMNRLKPRS